MAVDKGTPTPKLEKGAHQSKPWTLKELGGKTVWDWLQLLVVPLMLAVIGFWFTAQQDARQERIENQHAEAERKLAEQRAQDEALQAYLDQMGDLILNRNLRDSEEGSEVRTLARARTLTILGRVDAAHKRTVVDFLTEAGLIQSSLTGEEDPVISLDGADLERIDLRASRGGVMLAGAELRFTDLSGAKLSRAFLNEAKLHDADLRGADLRGANLSDAYLQGANLRGANLRYADLPGANLASTDLPHADLSYAALNEAYMDGDLSGVDLSSAILSGATLSGADLSDADLDDARLHDADLSGANLSGANLRGADLSGADLVVSDLRQADLRNAVGIRQQQLESQARALKGATMPDGSKIKTHTEISKMPKPGEPLNAGRYATKEFEPALLFSVSDNGLWQTATPESSEGFIIQETDRPMAIGFLLGEEVIALDPSKPEALMPQEHPEDLLAWLQEHPRLDAEEPKQVSVGGLSGQQLDVIASKPTEDVPNFCTESCVPVLMFFPHGPSVISVGESEKLRFILLQDVDGQMVVIFLGGPASEFEEFLPKAQELLGTAEWLGV